MIAKSRSRQPRATKTAQSTDIEITSVTAPISCTSNAAPLMASPWMPDFTRKQRY